MWMKKHLVFSFLFLLEQKLRKFTNPNMKLNSLDRHTLHQVTRSTVSSDGCLCTDQLIEFCQSLSWNFSPLNCSLPSSFCIRFWDYGKPAATHKLSKENSFPSKKGLWLIDVFIVRDALGTSVRIMTVSYYDMVPQEFFHSRTYRCALSHIHALYLSKKIITDFYVNIAQQFLF